MEKQISITKIKIRHSQILLFLNCPKKPETLQGELRFQNAWLNFCHPVAFYPVGKSLVCPINTDKLENYDGDWKLTIQDSNDTYTPVFTSRIRLSLLLGRHFVRNEETLFFPMGGASHSFLLRCRRWQKQDHLTFRIKELTAFGIAKLFGRSLKEKHMWLVYEKFCITAQENGFYFFEYCMKNKKDNVFFILDKKSPQWDYMQQYRKNIIPALSFRHILYLLCADLLISPDGRHHAYAWKPMPNPVTRTLNKQKLYFLQHGVLALKNVDSLFSVDSSSSVDYFTASSEFEKNIIVNRMGYNPDKVILKDISLFAKPGQKLAFVGSTGAGKTTITNLINRFYDIQEGKIRYDGINITKIKKDDLRRSLGIVLQDTHLFTGTIKENIRYGKLDATDEEVYEAARLAHADQFIKMLPKGYDTMLSGDGEELSQGQRQLLSIARAAVANPPVLILDEATSSIDTRTESIVQKGMDNLMKGRTVFVIAHRLSTIRNSDAIIVLDHGKIIERGDHEDLIKLKGTYYQLYTGKLELS